ncbi:hypothetical protein [Clostridium felsineum]|uniref:Uncharacterized protein n=1 Tax=Clostridium felsineum TaxID=36839 RepID=A0A1S8MF19_9CLOT|nr:hypothetical protein [Clostridium felsineum]MCR3758649.1 hypothetical protein [Clostridium felsineum]URZ09224.1 hypothetical protein CLROS_046400 [Clostridium felsineum]URZ13910.1 hypothetical protein CROST_046880 [Clostridium felsineum]URZ18545.1 hypothetical protein CLFE_046330 [Clostridium felsineum DSM 794]
MRIEENTKNLYTKHPDRIETYLIRVINRYFDSAKMDITSSREAIINEAVNRMKKDIVPTLKELIEEELKTKGEADKS